MSRNKKDDFTQRVKSSIRLASDLFQTKPDWVIFFREILGVNGVTHRLFPDQTDVEKFHKTDEYRNIQQMLGQLRIEQTAAFTEDTQMITPRLPKSLHRFLMHEVHSLQGAGQKMSLNQLVVAKLCVPYDACVFPKPDGT